MKLYGLNTALDFGKYKGKTILDIASIKDVVVNIEGESITIPDMSTKYLNWCAINVDFFYLSEETVGQIEKLKPSLKLSEEAKRILKTKRKAWLSEKNRRNFHHEDYYDNNDYDSYCGACGEDPCMCSDPEQTSTTYD